MKNIQSIQLVEGSNEELLPGFSPDFPYIASRALLDRYLEPATPWHWHRTVELFYMESGTLEYTTPNGKWVFPAGSGGFVNSNILHTSRIIPSGGETVQLLHLFEPELLSGGQASRIDTKYIRPLTAAAGIEMIVLSPDDAVQAELLKKIRAVFDLDEDSWGYEFILRQQLAEIWLALFDLARPEMEQRSIARDSDEKMKAMMRYIHAHYPDSISVDQLAKEAHISKRVCYRLFQENLHIASSIGVFDMPQEDKVFMDRFVKDAVYDDYDRLVQLCDALALPIGFCLLEKRFVDVAIRYGTHPATVDRWKTVLNIKTHFEAIIGCSIYDLLPGVVENSFR